MPAVSRSLSHPIRGRAFGGTMLFGNRILASLALTTALTSSALAATISGSLLGPDGKPFMGAFVVAENIQSKMTVNVLSNEQGRYRIGNLPAATYKVHIFAAGYAADARNDVRLAAN